MAVEFVVSRKHLCENVDNLLLQFSISFESFESCEHKLNRKREFILINVYAMSPPLTRLYHSVVATES
jgi:hypothetical protein